MPHYSVRITRDKAFGKLKESDLKSIRDEAVKSIYKLISQHIISYNLSEKDSKLTVLEFDIDVNTPRVTRDKELAVIVNIL